MIKTLISAPALSLLLWCFPAAAQGNSKGANECDKLAAHPNDPDRVGPGVDFAKLDAETAVRACREALAANPGNARLEYQLGRALSKSGNNEEAIRLYTAASKKQYAAGFFGLGVGYRDGDGTAQNLAEALRHFRLASELGHSAATREVGHMYAEGNGVQKSPEEAERWYERAANQGNVAGINDLASLLGSRKTSKGGVSPIDAYKKAAAAGNAEAAYRLGSAYGTGTGVARSDAEAIRWYRRAAELGNADAMFSLGVRYDTGRGVGRNHSEAVRWYRRAAELGVSGAMYNLAIAYREGEGVKKDNQQALTWFDRATTSGHPRALFQASLLRPKETGPRAPTLGFDCVVRAASTAIVAELGSPPVATASSGQSYFTERWGSGETDKAGTEWTQIQEVRGAELKSVGYVKAADLDCAHKDKSGDFPIIFDDPKKLNELGVDFPYPDRNKDPPFWRCFYNGDGDNGLPDMSLSYAFRSSYPTENLGVHVLCLVMRSGVVRFDPETGQRLATFIMVNRKNLAKGKEYIALAISEESPLEVPRCLFNGRVQQNPSFLTRLTLDGCSMKYHPWSGRTLNEAEQKFWRTAEIVVSSESAPDPSPEAVRLVSEKKSSASEAEIAKLTRRLKPK